MPAPRDRVHGIFHAALEREGASRAAFVTEACGADAELRREVESLLSAHDRAGDFLEQPAAAATGLVSSVPAVSLVGRQVGPYRVDAEIGRGGMGVVYLAEDTRLGRKVALKALAAEVTGDGRRRAWLRREARAAGALSHQGIATVYALEDVEGQFFIASEFVPGRTLRHRLVPGGMPVGELVDIALQMARALEAAHARGVVHRDLKPENVMCTPDGTIKLVDFGIAWVDEAAAPGARLTDAGLAAGTPAYMSPEQIEGGPIDFRTDLFSFGVLLYEMATGANPFDAPTPLATAARVASAEPPALASGDDAGSRGLERIARRCLMKRRDDRHATTRDLIVDLERLRDELSLDARTATHDRADPTSQARTGAGQPATWSASAWWAIHQVVVLLFYGVMILPMWMIHAWGGGGWMLALVGGYLAVSVINGVLRVHLLFAYRVHPSDLRSQLARSGPWIRRSDFALAALMLAGAASAAITGHGPAALLVAGVAVGLLAVTLVVEPATTAAAFPDAVAPPGS